MGFLAGTVVLAAVGVVFAGVLVEVAVDAFGAEELGVVVLGVEEAVAASEELGVVVPVVAPKEEALFTGGSAGFGLVVGGVVPEAVLGSAASALLFAFLPGAPAGPSLAAVDVAVVWW